MPHSQKSEDDSKRPGPDHISLLDSDEDGKSKVDTPASDSEARAVKVEEESTSSTPESDSIKEKGKNASSVEHRTHEAEGMACGYKELWSGPEDKRGRFSWLDKKPDDLGTPAEDVRHVRVLNDPRKVLKIHSIVIQSSLLRELLGKVLKDYPGVTTSLQRLTFSDRFEPIIHKWDELKAAISEEQDGATKEHANLLLSVLQGEFKETIEDSLDHKKNGVITFELLWTLFLPDALLYARVDGQERIFKCLETVYGLCCRKFADSGRDKHNNEVFWVFCQYVDWDGSKFGTGKIILSIYVFTGTQEVSRLRVYPLVMHHASEALKEKLLERGSKIELLAGIHYKQYNGVGWIRNQQGGVDKFNCKERVVIDASAFNKNAPDNAHYVTSFHKSSHRRQYVSDANAKENNSSSDSEDDEDDYMDDGDDSGMPFDGLFPDEDQAAATRKPLTDEQKMIASPVIRGYALKSKMWLHFFANCLTEIKFNEEAFKSLVLPEKQKELILGFTETQNKTKDTFDDFIEGKGRGIILLLCGPPGVGKTLTAESVSEQMQVPLYSMASGDLGWDPRHVERDLASVLEMCSSWNAVLLLDEADIFLEQRSLHELDRNKLVTIFLRVLETYGGIMFLTTNRVQCIDPAFQSRIHISLDYPELSVDSRFTVWVNFLSRQPAAALEEVNNGETVQSNHAITTSEMRKLAELELNGRQIKVGACSVQTDIQNAIKTGKLLAHRRDQKLSYEHIKTVLEVTQHWHNISRETDRARSAIYY